MASRAVVFLYLSYIMRSMVHKEIEVGQVNNLTRQLLIEDMQISKVYFWFTVFGVLIRGGVED